MWPAGLTCLFGGVGAQRLEDRVGDSSVHRNGYLEAHVEAICSLWG